MPTGSIVSKSFFFFFLSWIYLPEKLLRILIFCPWFVPLPSLWQLTSVPSPLQQLSSDNFWLSGIVPVISSHPHTSQSSWHICRGGGRRLGLLLCQVYLTTPRLIRVPTTTAVDKTWTALTLMADFPTCVSQNITLGLRLGTRIMAAQKVVSIHGEVMPHAMTVERDV